MIAAALLTVLLALLAVLQLAVSLGAPIGHFFWGGQHRVLPLGFRIGSIVAIVIYAFIASIALDRAGLVGVFPDPFSAVAMWVVFGFLALSIGPNAISRSTHERYTMTPVTIVAAVLSLLVALSA